MDSFEKLHSENVRAKAKDAILVLPVGAVEQHGPHLPLTVDTEIPVRIASMLVERLNVIVAPAIPYGARSLPHSGGGPSFPGPINIRRYGNSGPHCFHASRETECDCGAGNPLRCSLAATQRRWSQFSRHHKYPRQHFNGLLEGCNRRLYCHGISQNRHSERPLRKRKFHFRGSRALPAGRKTGRHKSCRLWLVESCFECLAGEALW